MPSLRVAISDSGRILPYAATTARSARRASNAETNAGSLSRSGWRSGTPAAAARALTGASDVFWPRPRGRSGCVTTPTTACDDARSASSVGTANAGVPKNARRRPLTVSPLARARQLLDPSNDEIALDPAQAIHE